MEFPRVDQKNKIFEIDLMVLTVLLYLVRATIPLLKFPFIALFIFLIFFTFLKSRILILSILKNFFHNFYVPLLLILILLISFLLSNKLYLSVFKDISNAIILLSLFFFMTVLIKSKGDLNLFSKRFILYIIFFAFLISISLLCNVFNISPFGNNVEYLNFAWKSYIGSLSLDYNFALLPVFFGIIGVIYYLTKPASKLKKVILNIILIIYFVTIIFSSSRRGLITLAALIGVLLVIQLLAFTRQNETLKNIGKSSRGFIISIITLSFLLGGFVFITPVKIKRFTLNILGITIKEYKQVITTRLFKFSTFFSNPSYSHFQFMVWNEKPNSIDPESGWAANNGTTVFPLQGQNVEIVPKNSIGFKMDRTCNGSYWDNNAYAYIDISNLLQTDFVPSVNEIYSASVYCYVSQDFDGTWAVISDKDGESGVIAKKYDFSKKGTWQKLQVYFRNKTAIYLYWAKYGVTDFYSLNGYIIFAYPQYSIIDKDGLSSSLLDPLIDGTNHLINNKIYQNSVSRYNKSHQYSASFFSFASILESTQNVEDPIRKWASKFISEDTTYYGYKKKLNVNTKSNEFLAGRLLRWEFAYQIYTKEYNWKQRIFGGGFNFLNWYGYYFLRDKTFSDYPHNPFLSVLLYSGLLGLLIYLLFFFRSFYYYYFYSKEYPLPTIFFIITFFFSFFSAGSPFDPPVMGFFVILPFFIHMVHKNSK